MRVGVVLLMVAAGGFAQPGWADPMPVTASPAVQADASPVNASPVNAPTAKATGVRLPAGGVARRPLPPGYHPATPVPITSTAATRRLDTSRRSLIGTARHGLPMAIGLKRADYLQKMRLVFRNKDWNQDGVVSWTGSKPQENLADVAKCVIVDYKHVAATSVKDKSKPGQVTSTPEHWEPVDWLTFLEVLGATAFDAPPCEAVGLVDEKYCQIGNKTYSFAELYPSTNGCKGIPLPNGACYPLSNPQGDLNRAITCSLAPTLPACAPPETKLCADKGGSVVVKTKMQGCETWTKYGPDSEAAFSKVAAMNFDREDWNANGRIDGSEGEFLCNR